MSVGRMSAVWTRRRCGLKKAWNCRCATQMRSGAWEYDLSFLRVFRYITFRSAGAAVTALLLSWWLGPKVIRWLKHLKFGQEYADRAEEIGKLGARVISMLVFARRDFK